MSLNKIKIALAKLLAEFGNVTTDKGMLQYDGDELEVGVAIVKVDEEGNTSEAEDGEYYLGEEDGRTLVIEGGKVIEIKDRVENPAEPEQVENEGEEGEDPENPEVPETPAEPAEPETPSEEGNEEEDEHNESGKTNVNAEEEVENPTNEGEESDTEAVVKLREEVNELYRIVDELKARIEKLEGKPAAPSAREEFSKIKKSASDKLDKFAEKYCK